MFKEYIKDGHKIKATEKAYEVIYRNQGYVELSEELETENEFIQDIEEAHELAIKENNIRSLEGLKVEELKEKAKEEDIEGYSKMKKEELIAALAGE
jgi:hypothetical protein